MDDPIARPATLYEQTAHNTDTFSDVIPKIHGAVQLAVKINLYSIELHVFNGKTILVHIGHHTLELRPKVYLSKDARRGLMERLIAEFQSDPSVCVEFVSGSCCTLDRIIIDWSLKT